MILNKKSNSLLKLALLVFGLLFSSLVMASAEQDFKRGLELFRSGDYSAAVISFEAAQKQGIDSVSLHYNLGSSYYKLGQYRKARAHFMRVKTFPRMRDLADYNLGLIAQKTGDISAARQYFSSVLRLSKDNKLRVMAEGKLSSLQEMGKPWLAFVSARLGYDDNITAAPSGFVQDVSDSFYDVFASVERIVSGSRKHGWAVDASYFTMDFSDNDDYDDSQLSLGISKRQPIADWDVKTHLSFNNRDYADEDFQSIVKLDLQGITPLSRSQRIYLRYIYEDINSDNALYDYLQGWRQRARFEYRNYQRKHISQLYYELELNDREDLDIGGYVASYSPVRHSIRGQYTYNIDARWSLSGDLSYRYSDYPVTISQDRQDDRWRLVADADYRLDKTTRLRTRVEYIDNASTLDIYDYDKSVISIGLSKLF